MRSAIARILTGFMCKSVLNHVNPVQMTPSHRARKRFGFLDFPIFLDFGLEQPAAGTRGKPTNTYKNLQNGVWAWHLPNLAQTMAYFLAARFGILFDAANKKGRFYTGGGSIFV
jgi:hypothetical protein